MASKAEASSTTLFIARSLAPFRNQFVNQRSPRLHVFAHKPLGALNAAFQSRNTQFIALNSQDHFVANTDPQPLAKRGRDHHAPVLVDPHPCFCSHVISPDLTLLYHMSSRASMTL